MVGSVEGTTDCLNSMKLRLVSESKLQQGMTALEIQLLTNIFAMLLNRSGTNEKTLTNFFCREIVSN